VSFFFSIDSFSVAVKVSLSFILSIGASFLLLYQSCNIISLCSFIFLRMKTLKPYIMNNLIDSPFKISSSCLVLKSSSIDNMLRFQYFLYLNDNEFYSYQSLIEFFIFLRKDHSVFLSKLI